MPIYFLSFRRILNYELCPIFIAMKCVLVTVLPKTHESKEAMKCLFIYRGQWRLLFYLQKYLTY